MRKEKCWNAVINDAPIVPAVEAGNAADVAAAQTKLKTYLSCDETARAIMALSVDDNQLVHIYGINHRLNWHGRH